MTPTTPQDADLVANCLAGDRDSFAEIVARYQSLICSLAYSATGSLSQSEDLAQETFVTAWKQLRELREPEQLRAWLCGIVRNLTRNWLRRQQREPSHRAEDLETVHAAPSSELLAPDATIGKEEEAILWRSLERIPETYREPLILFYRGHQSVHAVARGLGLSEEAVKQRLSRGRKLLHEQVHAFVEGALRRSAPGRAFTFGVLAALPVLATSAGAATVASAAAKGSATASSATLVSVVGAFLGPIIGIFGAWMGVKAGVEATRTPRERQFVVRQAKLAVALALVFNLVLAVYIIAAVRGWSGNPVLFAIGGILIPLAFTASILVMAFRYNRRFRAIRAEERAQYPEAFQGDPSRTWHAYWEYRSPWSFLGLPLVHVRSGAKEGEPTRPAVGWIAIGDRAYGILFAAGGVAVGGISMGGVAAGVIALGGASVGALAVGGFALGAMALGGGAIGLVASGGAAVAWFGAEGGFAIAREFAMGGLALARQANNDAARDFFLRFPWMDMTKTANRNWFMIICWLPMLLVAWRSLRLRQRSRRIASKLHTPSEPDSRDNGPGQHR